MNFVIVAMVMSGIAVDVGLICYDLPPGDRTAPKVLRNLSLSMYSVGVLCGYLMDLSLFGTFMLAVAVFGALTFVAQWMMFERRWVPPVWLPLVHFAVGAVMGILFAPMRAV